MRALELGDAGRWALPVWIATAAAILLCCAPLILAQQIDVDRELEEAKALYREAKFTQAIVKLQRAIGQIEQIRETKRPAQLADAHLHLALSLVALNDPIAAKESLKTLVRLDRERQLDPNVYAPKVIDLFEQARSEVAIEPAVTSQASGAAPALPPLPSATSSKRRSSKRLPILVGIGATAAAIGGAVAVASGGSSASPTATPIPAATPAGSAPDIVLLAASPPIGSTVSVSASPVIVTFQFSVVFDRTGVYRLGATLMRVVEPVPGGACAHNSVQVSVIANEPQTVVVPVPYLQSREGCSAFPVQTTSLTGCLGPGTTECFLRRDFPVPYTFVQ